ncbi:MAG: tRNA (adenosine(37)-N6)-threonylcarbamoyltransferase complex ATPase subunit type 1 TsaE [Bacteroidota bacterium]
MTGQYRTHSTEETRRVAREFAQTLKRGDVVGLVGDLGAGKTQFVKGVCEALGVTLPVASPTFVLLHRYVARDPDGRELIIHHLDLYRISSTAEILDLGYEELFFGDGICMVEWADRLGNLLPDRRIDVNIRLGESESEREIMFARSDPGNLQKKAVP